MSIGVSIDYKLQAVHLDPGMSQVAGFVVNYWQTQLGNPHPVPATFSVVSKLPSGVTATLSPTSINLYVSGGSAQCGIKFSAAKNAAPTNGPVAVDVEMKTSEFTGTLIFYLTIWQ
jgi:hypothetical protein